MSDVVGVSPPGSVLADGREAKGMAVADVAAEMNMMPFQIEALEVNDFEKFNSEMFVKGYIRRYADIIGVRPEPLLADCDKHFANNRKQDAATEKPKPRLNKHENRFRIAAVFVGAIALWAIMNAVLGGSEPSASEPAASAATLTSPERSIVVLTSFENGSTLDEAWISGPVDLQLSFKEDVSVKLRDAEGKVLVSGMQEQGETLALRGEAPFELILSYWPAVSLNYAGKPVDFSQVLTYSFDVARLRIGEK